MKKQPMNTQQSKHWRRGDKNTSKNTHQESHHKRNRRGYKLTSDFSWTKLNKMNQEGQQRKHQTKLSCKAELNLSAEQKAEC